MQDYLQFLERKHITAEPAGFIVDGRAINRKLFKFQRDLVRWALRLGRAALFCQVGMGKTAMQLEWAKHVAAHTGEPVLILSPLAVAPQTVGEGRKFNVPTLHVLDQSEVDAALVDPSGPRVFITNYDRIHLFDASRYGGVVLDESSILKHYTKTFFALTELFADTPYRLCCTATPAPNDFVEFGNHALFLGIMHFKDMLARWFVGEGDIARSARLKGHARTDFWRWLTSWAVCISKPSDLGAQYDMPGYDLPPLHIHEHHVGVPLASIERAHAGGRLMPDTAPSATDFMRTKRESLQVRVERAAVIVAAIPAGEPIVIWCDTDFEADALRAAIPEAEEVRGSHAPKVKEDRLNAFSDGRMRILITKPEIAGFGLNWQHCAHMIFAGVSFSFERWYQAIGRVHRFGQLRDVHIHLIYAETEGDVLQILKDKQRAFADMQAEMSAAIAEHGLVREESKMAFSETTNAIAEGRGWTYYLGDCVEVMRGFDADSIDLTVTSIPFSNLYIYSDKAADVGNAADKAEFFEHMRFVIAELFRITAPGRCCAVHVKDLPLFQNRDGVMGIDPFSDDVTAAFRAGGWVLQSRVTVEKDPVLEMQKTNSHGLLFKNWRERAEILRVGLPDYVLVFQKPGLCARPVSHDPADMTYHGANPPAAYRYPTLPSRKNGAINLGLPIWQEYANPNWTDVVVPLDWSDALDGDALLEVLEARGAAVSPVWNDIRMTDTLNERVARDDKDERHLCPLQLDLIARLIQWKSNPGDVVFDPFGGIASTGVKALESGRQFVGAELKDSYHKWGVKYLKDAETRMNQADLFTWSAEQAEAANS